jgi:orotidine-5'-phosphate decarboxylase
MIKPTKLEEQELKDLIDFQEKSEILISRLGQLQFRKLQIEKEEDYLKQQYEQIISSEIEISSKLKTKYGDINIDIKTGDITYPKI